MSEKVVLERDDLRRTLRRIAHEIAEANPEADRLAIVGIHTRGVPLAERLADEIERMEGERPRRGTIDITFYRDDISRIGPQPVVKETQLPAPIDPYVVVLCDDVLYTGRTVRAALDELNAYGRPRVVRLVVLVDRGLRELPIQADVVGKVVPTARSEVVKVGFESVDGADYVRIFEMTEKEGPG